MSENDKSVPSMVCDLHKKCVKRDIDIQSLLEPLKIILIRRLLDDNFHAWKSIPNSSFWIWELMQFFMTILNLPHIA